LLKVCYVPATSASLPRVSFFFSFLFLLLRPLTVQMKQTRWLKQSIFLDVYGWKCFYDWLAIMMRKRQQKRFIGSTLKHENGKIFFKKKISKFFSREVAQMAPGLNVGGENSWILFCLPPFDLKSNVLLLSLEI
jgi:hypothetical protein